MDDIEKIEGFRSRLAGISDEVSKRNARLEMLKRQIKEKEDELRELGIKNVEDCEQELAGMDEKIKAVSEKIEKELVNAESELGI